MDDTKKIRSRCSGTCRSHAVSCCASADSFAFEISAQVCPSITPAADARLCHSLRGRVGLGDGDDDDGGGSGWPPRLPAEEEATPSLAMGQKAYTVFFGFRDRNAWRSSSVCGFALIQQLMMAAGRVPTATDVDGETIVSKCERRGRPKQSSNSETIVPPTETNPKCLWETEKTCDNRDGTQHLYRPNLVYIIVCACKSRSVRRAQTLLELLPASQLTTSLPL